MEETQKESILDATATEYVGNAEQSIDDLKSKVRKQVEYYFSKENLQQDAYLMSQMDSNMSVPISVIMQDESLVAAALENSSVSIVDGRIKSNIKSGGRSTIILREIPTDSSEEEVREIFAFDGCKPISSMRSDIGDTWFVMMESEEDAKDTLVDLKLKKRTFRGHPVKGRMKSETIVRSFYPMQPAPPPMMYTGIPFPPYGPPMPVDMRVFGYGMMPNGMPNGMMPNGLHNGLNTVQPISGDSIETNGKVAAVGDAGESASAADGESGGASSSAGDVKVMSSQRTDRRNPQGGAAGQGVKASPQREVRERKAASGNSSAGGSTQSRDRQRDSGGQGDRKGAGGAAGRGGRARDPAAKGPPAPSPVEISAANFPPLQVQEADTPIPTPGYKGDFRKYSGDDIINIVKDIKDAVLPESIKPAEHGLAMTATPNLDLLKRQRTFSIDETREQLRQGRPVQREAISAGAVDYKSMIFGDGYQADGKADAGSGIAAAAIKPAGSDASTTSPVAAASQTSETPAPVSAAVVSGVGSPRKITASSWAAMVMSSTPPQLDGAGSSNLNPKPAAAKPEKAVAGKDAAKGKTTATKAVDSGTAKKVGATAASSASDKRRGASTDTSSKRDGKMSGKDASTAKGGKTEDATDGEKAGAAGSKENDAPGTEEVPSKAAEKAPTPPSWGGKATFASILKQQSETPAPGPAASAAVSPATSPKGSASSSTAALKNCVSSPQRKDTKGKKAEVAAKAAVETDGASPVAGSSAEKPQEAESAPVAPVAGVVH